VSRKPNPLDVQILRLVQLHGDRIQRFDPKMLASMTNASRQHLLGEMRRLLGISPLASDHIPFIDDDRIATEATQGD